MRGRPAWTRIPFERGRTIRAELVAGELVAGELTGDHRRSRIEPVVIQLLTDS